MLKQKWVKVLLAGVLMVAGLVGYRMAHRVSRQASYRITHRFPGRFLVTVSEESVYKYDMWGLHLLRPGIIMDDGFLANPDSCMYMLSLAPDGKSAAYIRERAGQVWEIAIRRVDRADPDRALTRRRGEEESFGRDNCESTELKGASSYGVALPVRGNLEWSPDGKFLAFADNTKLYIMDAKSGSVRIASLPEDRELAALARQWQAYERLTPVVRRESPGKLEGAYSWLTESVSLPNSVVSLFSASNERLKDALHLDKTARMYVPSDWQDLCSLPVSAAYSVSHIQFLYIGRPVRWVSADTIYCDNLKLTVSGLTGPALRVSVAKTPLVSGVAARPCWSPKGDKAAYVIDTHRDIAGPEGTHVEIVVVDANGKVIWKCSPSADIGIPHWSRDGKYLAIVNYPIDKRGHLDYGNYSFIIYEVGTSKSWKVPVPKALYNQRNISDWYVAGWDWEL